MRSLIVVHPDFDLVWPFAADHLDQLWRAQGEVTLTRLAPGDDRALDVVVADQADVIRLALLGVAATASWLDGCAALEEATFSGSYASNLPEDLTSQIQARGIKVYSHPTEGFWGQSVAEFGLALTLCGLRRIPQLHHRIINSQQEWEYRPPGDIGRPGARGHQFGDDPDFTSGTLAGKRVRIVGAGNIASRYAQFCHLIGAEVAAWDPFATEPCFHRSGSRREYHLEELVKDAQIFAPMVPLLESTQGIVTAAHIDALPKGCLVVLVTRAGICDMEALRRRVSAGELSLAADVFDIEPLPLDDPLLGHPNVVHTPHNAGRTIDANHAWAEKLAVQFRPRPGTARRS
ncbi:MAG: hydroxyacid dehydrogenase [Gemmatimonadetes bacterium]|jgi:phosphoglycerate dehydrogenase-like enzyme|nr:hydroxyacid dehydrogenase [Gemmatimonadota bacterium]